MGPYGEHFLPVADYSLASSFARKYLDSSVGRHTAVREHTVSRMDVSAARCPEVGAIFQLRA
jgi:hypothetical protein